MWSGLGDVDRSLSTADRDGRQVRVLVVERTYAADRVEVWDAVTSADRIARWLAPVSGELRLGGRYQVEGNAGGEVLRCDEPELLDVTWEFGGHTSWVVVTLTEEGGGTRLRLEHSAVVDDATWAQFGPGAVGIGWEMAVGGLGMHLAAPEAPRPDPDFTEPGYAAFVTRSGQAWAAADAASGTPPERAREAAETCIAAYTAPPESSES
jgi:uncharacterized protein YndB with AHSA1/START domain